jgi:hypothetical protein
MREGNLGLRRGGRLEKFYLSTFGLDALPQPGVLGDRKTMSGRQRQYEVIAGERLHQCGYRIAA